MAYPIRPVSDLFSNDQRLNYEALYFNTTSTAVRVGETHTAGVRDTALGQGVSMGLFDLLDQSFNPTSRADLEAAIQSTSGTTEAVLGYNTDGSPRLGIVPNIYMYWGAGAPPGCAIAKQCLIKFSGVIPETISSATLVACGQGNVRVYRNGTLFFGGVLKEPSTRAARTGLSLQQIQTDLGYQFNTTPTTLAGGDTIEVYYWHNGETWGGIGLKLLLGSLASGGTSQPMDFLTKLREAAVVGTSILVDSVTPISGQTIKYVIAAHLDAGKEKIPQLRLTVPIVTSDEPTGYRISRVSGVKVLRDNANTAFDIKVGRMVHFRAGTTLADGTVDLYPRYMFVIRDIDPVSQTEADIICEGIQSRMSDARDENYPDYLDYHMWGYVLREGSTEPVFGINALDNWPIEIGLALLAYRSGVDAMTLGYKVRNTQTAGTRFYRTRDNTVTAFGIRQWRARSLSTGGHVKLERQSNYGNVPPMQSDAKLPDDAYLFKPDVTQRLVDRMRSISSQLGYDFGETPDGYLFLRGRNNPSHWQPMVGVGPFATFATTGQVQSVSAVGGTAFSRTSSDTAWTRQFEGVFSRIDLYVGVGTTGGKLTAVVERKNGAGTYVTVATVNLSTYADTPNAFFYDSAIRDDGSNAAVLNIGSFAPDWYRVTISPAGPETGFSTCTYQLNGAAIYEYDPEATLYIAPTTQQTLSSLGNILTMKADSAGKDQINHVVVVGSRKATVGDSTKFNATANNPELEFNVAVGSDPYSMYDPTAPNFLGNKRMTVIFDEKVSDTDFAYWLVRTILYRYRNPAKDGLQFTHTALPILEPGDAVVVKEERHGTINHTIFLDSINEVYSLAEATSSFQGNPFPAIASYQPREDIDVDTLYPSATQGGKGLPVINVQIQYKNLYNRLVGNGALQSSGNVSDFFTRDRTIAQPNYGMALTAGMTQITLPAGTILETAYLAQYVNQTYASTLVASGADEQKRSRALVNNPYRQFFRLANITQDGIAGWNSSRQPTIIFDFQEGDGTADLYDQTYYQFPNTSWSMLCDTLRSRIMFGATAQLENPFYDPYSSEIGNLVNVSFDQLVSGRVRVSLWARSDSLNVDIPVAWLTNPTGDSTAPDAHYVYMDAGPGKSFYWDGTDTIGLWNTLNSSEWADSIKGSFGDRPNAVGKGFYVWNDKNTNTHTMIGDLNLHGSVYPNFDSNNTPYFTIGQYSKFFVKIDVLNDTLVQADMDPRTGSYKPRTVDSRVLDISNGWNLTTQVYAFTHLGEPNHIAVRIQDYTSTTPWVAGLVTADSDWTTNYSTPDTADASFKVGKPVRLTFVPQARQGLQFAGDSTRTNAKLNRLVHLKTMTFDQSVSLDGRGWKASSKPEVIQPPPSQRRTVTSRMFHNDDHTLEFVDGNYRTGTAIGQYEWVFDPSQFKKDFGTGIEEALRFGEYSQLETLPGYNAQNLGGTSVQVRAAMLMAFTSYLFYFSVFTQDRSGRRQWCLNSWTDATGKKRGFIDKGKIVTPTRLAASELPASATYRPSAIVSHEDRGADKYFARSVFVRQWKETYWADVADTRSPASKYAITDTFERQWLSNPVTNFDLDTTALTTTNSINNDTWLEQWNTTDAVANYYVGNLAMNDNAVNRMARRSINVPLNLQFCRPTKFGTWGFDRNNFTDYFQPSPKRDFHPYRRYPFNPDTSYFLPTFDNAGLTLLSSTGGMAREYERDPAAKQDWYGHAWAKSGATNWYSHGPMLEVSVDEATQDGRATLRANSANRLDFVSATNQYGELFDYIRSDATDRWDQFRGVTSRGPYASRTSMRGTYGVWDEAWSSRTYFKAANPQPVKASGAYLLNAFRYANYIYAPATINNQLRYSSKFHWTDRMYQFWDYRFHHEYVWYSDRYFPIYREGSPIYMYFKNEYTRLRDWVPFPWGSTPPLIYFDPGAWTGWKPDIPLITLSGYETSWASAGYLRWREVRSRYVRNAADDLGAADWLLTLTGGEAGMGTGRSRSARADHCQLPTSGSFSSPAVMHLRTNIHDEYITAPSGPRLAVGPEIPEARGIIMHLALSDTYRGT